MLPTDRRAPCGRCGYRMCSVIPGAVRLCTLCGSTVSNLLTRRISSIESTFPDEVDRLWDLYQAYQYSSSSAAYAELHAALGPLETQIDKFDQRETQRYHSGLRRARIRDVPSEPYTRAEVYKRDDGVCQVCRKPVDWHLAYPDLLSLSVDHRVPISRGGSDTLANVQLTHLRCNLKKGTKIL